MVESNKLFAEFLGYTYHNFSKDTINPGWRKSNCIHKLSMMGKVGERNYLCRTHKQLKFDTDWNWLMQVVEKIESLNVNDFAVQLQRKDVEPIEGQFYLSMFGKEAQFLASVFYWQHDNTIEGLKIEEGSSKIEAVYKACLAFINWYNENN